MSDKFFEQTVQKVNDDLERAAHELGKDQQPEIEEEEKKVEVHGPSKIY